MDSSELRERAVSAFAKGRFAKAAELYEAYCAQVPKDSQAWIRLGDAWSRLRKKDKAVAAYYQAAKLYADSGFFPRAIAACKLVLEIEPEHSGVKSMLDELYVHKALPSLPDASSPPLAASLATHRPSPSVAPVAQEKPSLPTPPPQVPTLVGRLLQEPPPPSPKPVEVLSPSLPSWAEAMKPPSIQPAALPASSSGHESRPQKKSEPSKAMPVVDLEGLYLPKTGAVQAEAESAVSTSSSGAFYAIEDAAKASLEAQGENPNLWLLEAKHTPASVGLALDIPLFSELPQPALMALFNHCPLRRFAPGMPVINQGERGNSFFIICSGEVRVSRVQGAERIELAVLKEGEFFGEMALLSGEPRSACVEALEPDTQVLEISAPALAELSKKFPQVSSALWRFYRQRLLSNVMASSALFRPFALEDRQQLIRCFQAVDVAPGTVVVAQNQMSEGLFVVLVGHLEVLRDGKKLATLKEGDLFGEISLLTKAPATARVVAVERSALLKLPANEFNTLISTHPQVLELLSRLMDERMHGAEEFSFESLGWDNEDFESLI